MIIENLGVADFFGMTLIGFPLLLYLAFVLFEGIYGIVNFFHFSNRRFR